MQNVFSFNEKTILKIIGRKKLSIRVICDYWIKNGLASCENPPEVQNYVAGAVRRITRKCEAFDLTWTLAGKGGGRTGRTVWRQKRKQRG